MAHKHDCGAVVVVFAKAPIPGQTKTRLIPQLGAQEAARVHCELIQRTLQIAINADVGPTQLWCAPDTHHPFFARCAREYGVSLHTQIEGDIGQRMLHAARSTLSRHACMALVGTDCPTLSTHDIREALTALDDGKNASFLPVEDGGYTLIALRQAAHELFEGIEWGTENVLPQTRERLSRLDWCWHELPVKWDLDRPGDYERLRREGIEEVR